MTRHLPMVLIFCMLIVFRFLGAEFSEVLPNFQPLSALFFCGALIAKDWKGWVLPLGIWLVTYPFPAILSGNGDYLTPGVLLVTGAAFLATYFIGKSLQEGNAGVMVVGSIAAAIGFHLITNGAAWLVSPMYAKTPLGLWQSLWLGPEGGIIPSWVFLRNMVCANFLFTLIFISARFVFPKFSNAPRGLAVR